MADTVNFTVGGEDIAVGPITLYTLQRCWAGALARLSEPPRADAKDRMDRVQAVLELVSTCLACEGKDISPDDLGRKVRLREWPGLDASLGELFRISGMTAEDPASGEAQAATGSTETGAASSPNSPTTA